VARIGLVLGGGGYAGTAFHAGVLTALAEHGWDARWAEVVVGTSAGATSASLLRAGLPPGEYLDVVLGKPRSAAAAEVLAGVGPLRRAPRPRRPRLRPAAPALLRRRLPFGVLLAALGPAGTVAVGDVSPGYGERFQRWPPRPTWITAVSLATGRRVVFGKDHGAGTRASLAEAVSASVAIPSYFAPVVIEEVPYVDGGAWSAHHADLLAQVPGLDLVVVSAPSATADPRALDAPNLQRVPIAGQLARELRWADQRGVPVLTFAPDRAVRAAVGLNSMALGRRARVASAAYAMAAAALRRRELG
jgi:NTE family protein